MSKIQNILISVKKSQQFWKSLDNLDKSRQSRLILTISIKISMQPSLDWKILILKILTEKKKVDLDRRENLNNLKKLVSTGRTFSILILIGLDCWDPQPYVYDKKP